LIATHDKPGRVFKHFRAPLEASVLEVSVTATKSAQGEHTGFISISRDISQMHADREALQILLAEMRHRLKNSFAMVCAMLRSFARGHSGNSEFADEMIARISALATAQTLFEGDQAETDLETLLTKLVSPFREVGGVDFNLNCPSGLDVFREQADAVSLVIGELTVNSTKHGAIGGGGRISLNVEVVDAAEGRQVALVWQERSRAPVTSTTRTGGQGLSIIERICRARGAVFSLDWQEYGLRARLLLPVDARL